MTLFFVLPDWAAELAAARGGSEKLLYAIPWDLSENDTYQDDAYCVVTERRMLLLHAGTIEKEIFLDVFRDFKVSVMSGAGIMEARSDSGEPVFMVRFSMEHAARYAAIAQKLNMAREGRSTDMKEEPDKKCLNCGRPLPQGSSICPRCVKKSAVLIRLFRLVSRYIPYLIAASVMMLISTGLGILMPKIYAILVNDIYLKPVEERGNMDHFLLLFAFVILAYLSCRVLIAVMAILRSRLFARLSSNMVHDLRVTVFEHIHAMSVSFTNDHKIGDLISRVTNDTVRIKRFIQGEAAECINQFLILFGVGIYLFFIHWQMALLVILPAPLIVLLMRAFHRKTHKIYRRLWRLSGKCNAVLQDILSGIRVVKSFGTEEKEINRYRTACSSYKNLCVSNEVFWNTVQPLIRLLTTLSHLALMLVGGIYILGDQMDAGTLVQLTTYAGMIYGPIQYMISLPRSIADAVAASARVFDILDQEPDISDAAQPQELAIRGDVEYREVYFGYKSYQAVLENINLNVKSGEMIGLVGHSGSGKSTIINLLLRFYDPDSGEIRIDGVNLRDISQAHLRGQIGVVLQETFLFSGSIYENIVYSKPDASREEVIRACKMANAHDFIMKFPDGYDTRIGQNGQTLSGGEKQRIAIARAIIHDPKILILDEATASLDTESEKLVQEALKRLVKNRTTFAIAHRLSTLKFADRLVVLDHGKIAESGTHDELLRAKGIYYGLVLAQLNMTRLIGQEEIPEEEYLKG